MDARIIGPASELGSFETLTFFGYELSREWSKLSPDPDPVSLRKFNGSRFIELREKRKPSEEPPVDTVAEIKARLVELGVEFDAKAKKDELTVLLEQAEAAHAALAGEQTGEEA